MRYSELAKLSKSFSFLAIGFLLLFSPFSGRAQSVSEKVSECGWVQKRVLESERVPRLRYNGITNRLETEYETRPVYVIKLVYDCVPFDVEDNSATSGSGNSSRPNTIRNADGTLRPARGYRWVNSKDPDNVRVEPMPGLIETENGKLSPAKGYRWVNPKKPKDFRVEQIP